MRAADQSSARAVIPLRRKCARCRPVLNGYRNESLADSGTWLAAAQWNRTRSGGTIRCRPRASETAGGSAVPIEADPVNVEEGVPPATAPVGQDAVNPWGMSAGQHTQPWRFQADQPQSSTAAATAVSSSSHRPAAGSRRRSEQHVRPHRATAGARPRAGQAQRRRGRAVQGHGGLEGAVRGLVVRAEGQYDRDRPAVGRVPPVRDRVCRRVRRQVRSARGAAVGRWIGWYHCKRRFSLRASCVEFRAAAELVTG